MYNCSRLTFKRQRYRIGYWSYQKLLHHTRHCKNSSIHTLTIFGSRELNGHPLFDQAHPKTIEIIFSFPEFALACKKSVHLIYSFLRYSPFYSPVTSLITPIFDHVHPKILWLTFNFCEFVSNAMSGYSTDFLWRYDWLKILQSDLLRTFWAMFPEYFFYQTRYLSRNTTIKINFHYITNSVKINNQIFR